MIQFDGTLPDGRDYELDIERNNCMSTILLAESSKKLNVKFYSVKGAEICFEADYSGVKNSVSVKGVHFLAEKKDDETRKVLDYANRTYQEIKADLEQKVPGLLELAYNSKIIPRAKGIDELF